MGRQVQPVVLDRRWDVTSLLGETFRLFWRHKGLFLAITAVIAVPYIVAIDLIWGEQLASEEPGFAWESFVIPMLLGATVIPALITALHVVSLLRIADGERPSVGEAFGLAADRVAPAIGATVLYMLAVAAGLILLVIPGIWLAVRLYFGAQAAVVDGLAPVDALKRSFELVRNRWWVTLGRFLLAAIVFGLCMAPLSIPLQFLDFGVAYVVLDVVVNTIGLSLSALFGTLVFMDYHGHRAEGAAQPEPAAYGGFAPPRPPGPFG